MEKYFNSSSNDFDPTADYDFKNKKLFKIFNLIYLVVNRVSMRQ